MLLKQKLKGFPQKPMMAQVQKGFEEVLCAVTQPCPQAKNYKFLQLKLPRFQRIKYPCPSSSIWP